MAKFIGKAKYIVFGMIMNLCLGSVYSWSIFRKPVEKAFEGIDSLQSGLPYMFFLFFYSFWHKISNLSRNFLYFIAVLSNSFFYRSRFIIWLLLDRLIFCFSYPYRRRFISLKFRYLTHLLPALLPLLPLRIQNYRTTINILLYNA